MAEVQGSGAHGAVGVARAAAFQDLAERAGDVHFVLRLPPGPNPRLAFDYVSPSVTRLLGYSPEDFARDPDLARQIVHPEDWPVVDLHLRDLDAAGARADVRTTTADGDEVWLRLRLLADRDPEGRLVEVRGVARDISELQTARSELSHQARHDALTGLPNRVLLLDLLGRSLRRLARRDDYVSLLFVDVDRFKVVNDSLGHRAGDELLRTLAQRLQRAVRPADIVARLGSDEFVVLVEDVADPGPAIHVAERILATLIEPVHLNGHDVFPSGSIGIALAGKPDVLAEDLLRDADAAMSGAKAKGRNRWELFNDEMRADAVARFSLEAALRRAISDGQLRIHLQPEVDTGSGVIVGAEALVRWEHPERGLLAAGEFIQTAEDSGLIVPLGEWVLREACLAVAGAPGLPDGFACRVNLSARQLAQPALPDLVERTLAETGLRSSRLCLEITETALMEDPEACLERLRVLRSLGVRLAVDDFGTGYSSLLYLKRFPVDTLKVDRSFVAGLRENPEDTAIVTAVVTLAWSLGMDVVAEGVETEQQRSALVELGCNRAQGYLFGKPEPAADLLGRLAR